MDDEYTPTTGDVRDAYLRARYYLDNAPEGAEGYRAVPLGFDRWLAKHDAEVAATIADRVRRNCTPSVEALSADDYHLIYAVADWIENPPEWIDAPWAGRGK